MELYPIRGWRTWQKLLPLHRRRGPQGEGWMLEVYLVASCASSLDFLFGARKLVWSWWLRLSQRLRIYCFPMCWTYRPYRRASVGAREGDWDFGYLLFSPSILAGTLFQAGKSCPRHAGLGLIRVGTHFSLQFHVILLTKKYANLGTGIPVFLWCFVVEK